MLLMQSESGLTVGFQLLQWFANLQSQLKKDQVQATDAQHSQHVAELEQQVKILQAALVQQRQLQQQLRMDQQS